MLAHFFSTMAGRLSGPGALAESRDVNSLVTSSVVTTIWSRRFLIRGFTLTSWDVKQEE